jgi:DNA (cytosine-5)-methyltransferase 3A
VRNYWTNIKTKKTGLFSEIYSDIPQPQDKGILLKDILQPESEVDEKYYLSETALKRILTGQLNADLGTIGCVNDRGKLRNIDKATNLDSNSFKGIDNHGQRTMVKQLNPSKESGGRQPYQQNRIYDINGKSPYMPEQLSGKSHKINTERLRRLTLNECCRLQGVPDNFFNGIVSDTQAYKMLGNGFTVPVIEHILKFL